ncbi:palmitoyltransferase Akr1p [Diutina catenulata]
MPEEVELNTVASAPHSRQASIHSAEALFDADLDEDSLQAIAPELSAPPPFENDGSEEVDQMKDDDSNPPLIDFSQDDVPTPAANPKREESTLNGTHKGSHEFEEDNFDAQEDFAQADEIPVTEPMIEDDPITATTRRFMTACQLGNLVVVKELVGADPTLVTATLADTITGLHWACINNRLSVVRFLVEHEADPNAFGGELEATPLHWACRNGLVYIADYLLRNGADPSLRDAQSYNALHLATHSSNITLVIYLLYSCCHAGSKTPLYVDEPDNSDRTSLHWAAYQGDILTVNALLKFGADVSKCDNQLFLPLHWAFMRGQRNVLSKLSEAGSNIFAKNNAGKDSFAVAADMNCTKTWLQVLKESGRTPANQFMGTAPSERTQKLAKGVTFLVPYVLLPICFSLCSFGQGFFIPKLFLAMILSLVLVFITNKFIAPTYVRQEEVLLSKTPFLAGVFSGTAFWAVASFVWVLIPALWWSHFIATFLLLVSIGLFTFSFAKTMTINPGYVPVPADNAVVLSQIHDLIAAGKFDTDHFCVNTFVRKPLRSRYSRHSRRLIARFDHFCPWVYNEVGVRNHKLFLTFVYALNAAIFLFVYLVGAYFDLRKDGNSGYESDDEDMCWFLGDDACYGFRNHPYLFNVAVWCCMQYVWLTFLTVVQSFQVLRGLTTWELSQLNTDRTDSRYNHSTVPKDFGDDSQSPPPDSPRAKRTQFQMCLSVLGIDQFIITVKMSAMSWINRDNVDQPLNAIHIPTDFGPRQNWCDFWFLGDVTPRNLFYLPIEGENNLNGQVVDYYKLYEYPERV